MSSLLFCLHDFTVHGFKQTQDVDNDKTQKRKEQAYYDEKLDYIILIYYYSSTISSSTEIMDQRGQEREKTGVVLYMVPSSS